MAAVEYAGVLSRIFIRSAAEKDRADHVAMTSINLPGKILPEIPVPIAAGRYPDR